MTSHTEQEKREPTKNEAIVKKGLLALHHNTEPKRDRFTHDEIAISAIVHHERYMKWYGRVRTVLEKLGFSPPENPTRVPSTFKMPTVSDGLQHLKSNGELIHEHVGDVRTSISSRTGDTTYNYSSTIPVYGLTPEALAKAADDDAAIDARNGNGTAPSSETAQALVTETRRMNDQSGLRMM